VFKKPSIFIIEAKAIFIALIYPLASQRQWTKIMLVKFIAVPFKELQKLKPTAMIEDYACKIHCRSF